MIIDFVPAEDCKYTPEFCEDCKDYQQGCGTCSQLITLKQDLSKWMQDVYGIDE